MDCDQIQQHPQTEALVAAVEAGDLNAMTRNMGNVLAPITTERYPVIKQLSERLLQFGADVAQMSGSGPTVFGICSQYSRAQRIYNSMSGFCAEVYLVKPLKP